MDIGEQLLKGNFQQLLEKIPETFPEGLKNRIQAKVYYYQGKFKESIEFFEKAMDLENSEIEKLKIISDYTRVYIRIGEITKAEQILQNSKNKIFQINKKGSECNFEGRKAICRYSDIFSQTDDKKTKEALTNYYTIINYFNWSKGIVSASIECQRKLLDAIEDKTTFEYFSALHTYFRMEALGARNLELIPELRETIKHLKEKGYKMAEAESLNLLGVLHYFRGEYEKSLEIFKQALEISEKIGMVYLSSLIRANIGGSLKNLGFINQALEYLQPAFEFEQRVGITRNLPLILNNIAFCYILLGDYEKGKVFLQQSLELFENYTHPYSYSATMMEIAQAEYITQNYDEAWAWLQKVHERALEEESIILAATALFYMIQIAIETGKKNVQNLIMDLKQVAENHDIPKIKFLSDLANAIFLKDQGRFKQLALAEEILKDLEKRVDETEINIRLMVYLHLLDILLMELLVKENPEIIREILEYTNNMNSIATLSEIPHTKLEMALLNAKIQIMAGKLKSAMDILDEVEIEARKYALKEVQAKAISLKDEIEQAFEELASPVPLEKTTSFSQLQKQELIDYLKKVQKIVSLQ